MNESEKIDPRELSPLALAFVGDSVLELLVRQRLASQRPADSAIAQGMDRVWHAGVDQRLGADDAAGGGA